MENIVNNIINSVFNSFDIQFCFVVNIATYLVIKFIKAKNKKFNITTWGKRLLFLITSIIIAIVYCYTGSDFKIIFNSIIIAPVTWSWIFKPICSRFNIDYNSK